ncbi:hypothetical protein C8J56DRAFT_1139619 [Mycena floridula]|nr:hypothetical protein C8J56DRAFT_1139619 [Mycena floridula]
MSSSEASPEHISREAVISQFRTKYHELNQRLQHILSTPTDTFLVLQFAEQLEEFNRIIQQFSRRPRTTIDPQFLQYAYSQRTTTGIAHFLGIGRTTARHELLTQGLAQPGPLPSSFDYAETSEPSSDAEGDELLEPELAVPQQLPSDLPPCRSGPHTEMSTENLDSLITQIRSHFRRAGTRMLHGILQSLGYRIQFDRIRQSLIRIDPVHRIFDRIRLRRRGYNVTGPNALWHHDGQHCKSVHNVRIERLWVDVTAQVGHTWGSMFDILELHHGLDINNQHHLWLLHHLFLGTINDHLALFTQGWNEHRIQIQGAANRSPNDMFVFDNYIHGVRGHQLDMTDDELEVYGIDWEGLNLDRVRESQMANNPQGEDSTSWVGQTGPPAHLNEVLVEPPTVSLAPGPLEGLQAELGLMHLLIVVVILEMFFNSYISKFKETGHDFMHDFPFSRVRLF